MRSPYPRLWADYLVSYLRPLCLLRSCLQPIVGRLGREFLSELGNFHTLWGVGACGFQESGEIGPLIPLTVSICRGPSSWDCFKYAVSVSGADEASSQQI
jgi:hypothetical protein